MFLSLVSDTLQAMPFIVIVLFFLGYMLYLYFTQRIAEGMRGLLIVPVLLVVRYVSPLVISSDIILTVIITGIDCGIALLYISWFASAYGRYGAVVMFSLYTGVFIALQITQIALQEQNFVVEIRGLVGIVPVVFLYVTNRKAIAAGSRSIQRIRIWFFSAVLVAFGLGIFRYDITNNAAQEVINYILLLMGYFVPLIVFEATTFRQAAETAELQNTAVNRLFSDLRRFTSETTMSSSDERDNRSSIDSALEHLIASISTAVNPDGIIILLLDQFNENLEIRKIHGVFPPVVDIPARILKSHVGALEEFMRSVPIKPGSTFLGEVFSDREPIYIRSMATEQQNALFSDTNIRQTVTSLIAFPLFAGEKNFGVMALTRSVSRTPFSQVDYSQAELLSRYASLIIDNRNSYIEVLEKQQIEQEIGIAADIQVSLLPKGQMLESAIADIAVYSKPLKGVSGDYFDMLEIPGTDTLAVLICDVAGKGIPAALLMVLIRTVFHTVVKLQQLQSAGGILTAINSAITDAGSIDRFATIEIVLLQRQENGSVLLDFANAGHHPLLLNMGAVQESEETMELDCDGIPVGIDPDFRYIGVASTIEKGDIIVLYTDGISEIRKGDSHNEYGSDKIKAIIQEERSNNTDLPKIKDRLLDDMALFAENSKQHDDQTLVLLKMKDT